MHLLNIRRVAWGIKELSDLRGSDHQSTCQSAGCASEMSASTLSRAEIEAIARTVIAQLTKS